MIKIIVKGDFIHMTNCPECGGTVSERLSRCPHCGSALKKSDRYSQFYAQPKPYQPESKYIEVQPERPRPKNSSKSTAFSISAFIVSIMGFLMSFIAVMISASRPKEVYVEKEVPVYHEVKTEKDKDPISVPDKETLEDITQEPEKQEVIEDKKEKKAEEPKAQKNFYSVGETWENKYVLVSYDDCGEFVSDNQFLQPDVGNKYIYAKFTFENVGKSDTTVGYWDFDCYADGYACDGAYLEGGGAFSRSLSVGRKITGTIYYEVPEGASSIELEYSPNFWTSEKIVFVYQ